MATEKVFMAGKRYTDEFNIEAVRQVTEHGRPIAEVAQRFGIRAENHAPNLPRSCCRFF